MTLTLEEIARRSWPLVKILMGLATASYSLAAAWNGHVWSALWFYMVTFGWWIEFEEIEEDVTDPAR